MFKNTYDTCNNFQIVCYHIYMENAEKTLEEIEALRKRALRAFYVCLAACLAAPPLTGLILGLLINISAGMLAGSLCVFAAVLFSVFYYRGQAAGFKAAYAEVFVKDILFKITGLIRYEPHAGFPYAEVMGFIEKGDSYRGSNYVEAVHQGAYFRCAQGISSTTISDSDGGSSTSVHFSGMIYMFPYPSGKKILCLRDRAGKFGLKLPFPEILSGNDAVDKRFKLYADDAGYAQRLLNSPPFAGFLGEVSAVIQNGLNIYVKSDCLYVLVNSSSHFKLLAPGIFTTVAAARAKVELQLGEMLAVTGIFAKYLLRKQ